MSRENHAPSFGSDLYMGFVAEHSAHLTAVNWAPGVSPKVHDRDQLVAAETEAVEPLTSTVTVRVNIVDTNNHPPMFTRDTYEAVVAEDAKKGTLVTTVTATDPDSGSFGRVRYTSLNGPIARNLKLDPETGEVTLTSSEGLDRESVPEYVLVVEAHDDDGRGQRASAQLRIRVGDANDNAPAFAQSRYDAVLTADLADFTEPLVVKEYLNRSIVVVLPGNEAYLRDRREHVEK
ncbi:unnamed protein product [Ixodes persulcatus]